MQTKNKTQENMTDTLGRADNRNCLWAKMLDLIGIDFEVIINIFKESKETFIKEVKYYDNPCQVDTSNQGTEILKKNQVEILELKSTVTNEKLGGSIVRFELVERKN